MLEPPVLPLRTPVRDGTQPHPEGARLGGAVLLRVAPPSGGAPCRTCGPGYPLGVALRLGAAPGGSTGESGLCHVTSGQ
jgi:hypothetical protein